MKYDINAFEMKKCIPSDLDSILEIQDETFASLEDKDLLRKNTDEMLLECLKHPHVTLGAWHGGRLAAFSVLYFPGNSPENLAASLTSVDGKNLFSANYKLCIVRPDYRGNSLQYILAKKLEDYAVQRGAKIICSTVSPKNPYSMRNVEKLGYIYDHTLTKYGLERNLYYKYL